MSIEEINGVKYRQIPKDNIKKIGNKFYVEQDAAKVPNLLPDNFLKLEIKRQVKVGTRKIIKTISKYYREINNPMVKSDKSIILELLNAKDKVTELSPRDYINGKISAEKSKREAEIKVATDKAMVEARRLEQSGDVSKAKEVLARASILPRTPLLKAAEFIIAETEGSNLKELMALEGIDKERTTCNNMHVIAETLGIEAARNFVIRALSNTIADNRSYVNPANITFIAEFITSRGEPFGATFTGISRQPGGHLSLSTLERAGKVFTKNALHGRPEDIRNVSAAVVMGERIAVGDGAFDIAQDITENGKLVTLINTDLFTGWERDQLTETVRSQQAESAAAEGAQSTLDALDDLTLGPSTQVNIESFERSREKDANLQTLFIREPEILPDTAAKNRVIYRQRVDRAVAPELVDVQDFIKVGIPETRRVTVVQSEVITPVPIISTGLIVEIPTITSKFDRIPAELDVLLQQFTGFEEVLEEVLEREVPEALTRVEELPQVAVQAISQIPQIQQIPQGQLPTGTEELSSLIEAIDEF